MLARVLIVAERARTLPAKGADALAAADALRLLREEADKAAIVAHAGVRDAADIAECATQPGPSEFR